LKAEPGACHLKKTFTGHHSGGKQIPHQVVVKSKNVDMNVLELKERKRPTLERWKISMRS